VNKTQKRKLEGHRRSLDSACYRRRVLSIRVDMLRAQISNLCMKIEKLEMGEKSNDKPGRYGQR